VTYKKHSTRKPGTTTDPPTITPTEQPTALLTSSMPLTNIEQPNINRFEDGKSIVEELKSQVCMRDTYVYSTDRNI
jgi:hypothetical protein